MIFKAPALACNVLISTGKDQPEAAKIGGWESRGW
jgi:hypothetical protein